MNAEFEKAVNQAIAEFFGLSAPPKTGWVKGSNSDSLSIIILKYLAPFSPSKPGEAAKRAAQSILEIFLHGYTQTASFPTNERKYAPEVIQSAIDSETAGLRAENIALRALVAVACKPCHYCGLDDMSKCKSGFPGCALMDDLVIGWDEGGKRLQAENAKLREIAKGMHEALRRIVIEKHERPSTDDVPWLICTFCNPTKHHTGHWVWSFAEVHSSTCPARPDALEGQPIREAIDAAMDREGESNG